MALLAARGDAQHCTNLGHSECQGHHAITVCAYVRRTEPCTLHVRPQAARHHEESDDDEGEWTEEEDASTPLDPIDPFIAFADTLEGLRLQDPARLQVHPLLSPTAG